MTSIYSSCSILFKMRALFSFSNTTTSAAAMESLKNISLFVAIFVSIIRRYPFFDHSCSRLIVMLEKKKGTKERTIVYIGWVRRNKKLQLSRQRTNTLGPLAFFCVFFFFFSLKIYRYIYTGILSGIDSNGKEIWNMKYEIENELTMNSAISMEFLLLGLSMHLERNNF